MPYFEFRGFFVTLLLRSLLFDEKYSALASLLPSEKKEKIIFAFEFSHFYTTNRKKRQFFNMGKSGPSVKITREYISHINMSWKRFSFVITENMCLSITCMPIKKEDAL